MAQATELIENKESRPCEPCKKIKTYPKKIIDTRIKKNYILPT
jgi:hypothetical protein